MPVALVPEGFKLQKVTQLQKEAVDSYNNNTSVQAFFDGPASGELVKAIAFVVTPIILIALAKQGFEVPDTQKFLDGLLEKVPGFDLSDLGKFSP